MSFCATAIVAAKIAVNAPMNATTVMVCGSRLMSGNMRTTAYTPADTIVAAWIIALTGVGPSIASGSQTCSGNCADLPTVPMKSSKPIKPAAEKPKKPLGTFASVCKMSSVKISRNESVPVTEYRQTIPNNMNTSPTRVVMNAFTAASRAEFFAYQKPINKYEHRPIISQPTKSVSRLSESTKMNMPKANRPMNAKKREYKGSTDGTVCWCPCNSTVAPCGGKPL